MTLSPQMGFRWEKNEKGRRSTSQNHFTQQLVAKETQEQVITALVIFGLFQLMSQRFVFFHIIQIP